MRSDVRSAGHGFLSLSVANSKCCIRYFRYKLSMGQSPICQAPMLDGSPTTSTLCQVLWQCCLTVLGQTQCSLFAFLLIQCLAADGLRMCFEKAQVWSPGLEVAVAIFAPTTLFAFPACSPPALTAEIAPSQRSMRAAII